MVDGSIETGRHTVFNSFSTQRPIIAGDRGPHVGKPRSRDWIARPWPRLQLSDAYFLRHRSQVGLIVVEACDAGQIVRPLSDLGRTFAKPLAKPFLFDKAL